MAKPKFHVQHFLICQDATWQGLPGPRTLKILDGVGYIYQVPSDAELPKENFWIYLRLFLTNNQSGHRSLWIDVYWLDAPDGERWITMYPLADLEFQAHSPITEYMQRLPKVPFLRQGRYEFRLKYRVRNRYSRAVKERIVRSEFIRIEKL